jgi:hypothetical protein
LTLSADNRQGLANSRDISKWISHQSRVVCDLNYLTIKLILKLYVDASISPPFAFLLCSVTFVTVWLIFPWRDLHPTIRLQHHLHVLLVCASDMKGRNNNRRTTASLANRPGAQSARRHGKILVERTSIRQILAILQREPRRRIPIAGFIIKPRTGN